jgi:peptide/nickel transport system substrate-binding protein
MRRINVVSRRIFLRNGGVTIAGLASAWALAACGETTPTPGVKKPTVAAGQPATPPVAAATAVSKAPETKIGKNLVGKLEGPEHITDPAKWPKKFSEAPMLAELVKAGKLPPVEKRVPEEPLVLKPVREIGKYGGTWRRGFTGPSDNASGFRAASGTDFIIYTDYKAENLAPNLAKSWEVSSDGKTFTVNLRRGMKWSDGEPFTADDFLFWWEDIYGNKDLFPSPAPSMMINGKPGTFEKVDALTIRWKFPEPYYLFMDSVLAGPSSPGGGQATRGLTLMCPYVPAHYLKKFHPKYTPKDQLDTLIKDAKFDNWINLIKFKSSWHLDPNLPVVSPWKTVTPANTPVWTMERNPYSIWVDTEGNQLPYIDKLVMTLGESTEVINLRAVAGEYDLQEMHLDIAKLPVFLENQERGKYTVRLDPSDNGGDATIRINNTFEGDPEINKWLNTTDFRRAISLGINRDQINETFWLGTGTPGSVVPAETNKYSPGPEYRLLWHNYDPQKANEMLDKLGLDKKDSEGYRLRTDGKGRLRLEVITVAAWLLPYTLVLEMVRDHWKKIGIYLDVLSMERSLAVKKFEANEHQLFVWTNDGSEFLYSFPLHVFPERPGGWGQATEWGRWYMTGGKQGKEPAPRMKEIMEKFNKAYGLPEAEQVKLGKEIWKISAEEVYNIGLVGLAAAVNGVRLVKNNMGNVPERQVNSPRTWNSASRPVTYYFKG